MISRFFHENFTKKDVQHQWVAKGIAQHEHDLFGLYWNPDNSVCNLDIRNKEIKIEKRKNLEFYLEKDNPAFDVAESIYITIDEDEFVLDGYIMVEAMSAMYESALYPEANYEYMAPYDLPRLIAKKLRPDYEFSLLNIGLLCEISLEFHNPGVIFYEMLNNIAVFSLEGIKDYIDNCNIVDLCKNNDKGQSFEEYQECSYDNYKKALNKVIVNSKLKETVNHISAIAEKIYQLKKDFFVPIYVLVTESLGKNNAAIICFMYSIEPILQVDKTQYYCMSKRKECNTDAGWYYWICINRFWNFISKSVISQCPFFEECKLENNENQLINCKNAPFESANEICLFLAIAKVFNVKI